MKTKLTSIVLIAALWLLSLPVSAQQTVPSAASRPAQDEADEVVRITTNLVQIDAVVTDKDGRHVPDLGQQEFEIYENGRRQEITNFSYVASGEYEASPVKPAADTNAPPAPPVALRPEQVRRTIALVVDDLGLSFESIAYIRDALKRFVERELQPGDLVAVMRTSAGSGQLQQFTADRRRLAAAIDSVRWRGFGRGNNLGPLNLLADDSGTVTTDQANAQLAGRRGEGGEALSNSLDDFREDLFAVGTLGSLGHVVRGMREMPGRKSILLMSDGLTLLTPEGLNQRVLAALQHLTDLANRSSVVLYTLDARGLPTLGLTAADGTSRLNMQQISDLPSRRRQEYRRSQEGLHYLAEQTGGFFVRNNNDLAAGIRRVINDQRGYYLIGYRPEPSTFDAATGRSKFHRVEVRVKRSGVGVRSRTGFYGISDDELRPAAKPTTRNQQLLRALMSPFGAGEIGVRLTPLFANDPQTGPFMRALLFIDAKNLTFTEEADNWRKAVIDVAAVTLGAGGQVLDEADRTHTVKVRGRTYEKVRENGFLYTFLVPIKKAGAYQLHMAVRDSLSERVGAASQFIEVPDLSKDRLALSGIVLHGEQPAPASKAPAPETATEDSVAEQEVAAEASPAVRRLRAGMNLDYSLMIYNAQIERATNQPRLRSQVRLFRDGQMIFAGKEEQFPPPPAGTAIKQIPVGGRLRLGNNMTPGPYVLQIIVTDTLAKGKRRTQTQWMDFEVTAESDQ